MATPESDETSSLLTLPPRRRQQQQQQQQQQLQSESHPRILSNDEGYNHEQIMPGPGCVGHQINATSNSLLDDDDVDNGPTDVVDGQASATPSNNNFVNYGTTGNVVTVQTVRTSAHVQDGHTEHSNTSTNDETNGERQGRQDRQPVETRGDQNSSNNVSVGDDEGSEIGGETAETRDGTIGALTRRLRCLFSTITWPIVPLGTIVALALLWVFYAASSLDLRKSCSHPLHWYALASLILVAYIPNHATIRSHLFQYSRERDGPIRPARVRMYDQFFHTICLLYVYTGVTLIQTCREDVMSGEDARAALEENGNDVALQFDGPINTCQATCPNLYQALSVYVATLEMFTFALILPLLFLPCIYLWFLRRATAEAEAFAHLQDRLQEEEALLNNGGVTVGQILDGMEKIKLVSRQQPSNLYPNYSQAANPPSTIEPTTISSGGINTTGPNEENLEDDVWLLSSTATCTSVGMKSDVKECCICMNEFEIQNEADLEDGLLEETGAKTFVPANLSSNDGRFGSDNGSSTDSSELASSTGGKDNSCKTEKDTTIVRTKCGHIFHQECLAGWIGGRWQLNPNTANVPSDDNGTQTARRRRARQTCCPLCREDLRPNEAA